MRDETNFEDLTTLFQAEDDAFTADDFVSRVMRPIRQRARWRQALLFGAGGVGIGAAVSQILSWASGLDVSTSVADTTAVTIRQLMANVAGLPDVWLLAGGVMIVCIAAMAILERA